MFLPFRRATLLIASGQNDIKHLFIILTNPDEKKNILMVPVSTLYAGALGRDHACLLYQGDHEFIRHDSYVRYKDTQIQACEALTQGVKSRMMVQKPAVATELFSRILDGLLQSPFVTDKILTYYHAQNQKGSSGFPVGEVKTIDTPHLITLSTKKLKI